jgi:hypothetical protein
MLGDFETLPPSVGARGAKGSILSLMEISVYTLARYSIGLQIGLRRLLEKSFPNGGQCPPYSGYGRSLKTGIFFPRNLLSYDQK